MSAPPLAIERPSPDVAVVHLQRPAQLNALDDRLIAELTVAAEQLGQEAGLKAIVLTGGAQMFCAGMDLSAFDVAHGEADSSVLRQAIEPGRRLIEAWAQVPQITVAAVEGGAVGGGFGLTLACDWRVFAQDAWGYVPEVKLGLTYGWGLLPRLASLVGPARAKWIATLCRKHPCAELQQWGLVEQVAPSGQALEVALALARDVAAWPARAVQAIKRTVDAGDQALFSTVSHSDVDDMLACLLDEEGARVRARTLGARAGKAP